MWLQCSIIEGHRCHNHIQGHSRPTLYIGIHCNSLSEFDGHFIHIDHHKAVYEEFIGDVKSNFFNHM